ncbi:hypothetical protein OUZ56_016622 [Daphnia magna]|uniref:Uncharacterized protein n=1 Tax=Daphnia magna TaxID=35525 RepID=A0ABR0AR74_9CRUS|nr:hypothetical protein OUZ56_016622 [Daphnia magna]
MSTVSHVLNHIESDVEPDSDRSFDDIEYLEVESNDSWSENEDAAGYWENNDTVIDADQQQDHASTAKTDSQEIVLASLQKYYHVGVEAALYNVLVALESKGIKIPLELKLLLNMDGIPISKSSTAEFWPILFRIIGWDNIFVAGIYHGPGKPGDVNQFLYAFKEEVPVLSGAAFSIKAKLYTFQSLKYLVMARQLLFYLI